MNPDFPPRHRLKGMLRKERYSTAVALRYGVAEQRSGVAPLVTTSGRGEEADEIVRVARRFGIPVVEDGRVARLLQSLPRDIPIPPALFEAVAILLHRIEAPRCNSATSVGGVGAPRVGPQIRPQPTR